MSGGGAGGTSVEGSIWLPCGIWIGEGVTGVSRAWEGYTRPGDNIVR